MEVDSMENNSGVVDMTKTCRKCHETKPVTEFFRDKGYKSGRASQCKTCKYATTSKWRIKNKDHVAERARAYRRKMPNIVAYDRERIIRSHGISPADYERMLLDQCGKCAICEGTDPKGCIGTIKGLKRSEHMHIDHDHKTDFVRGLLCGNCNKGLGLFLDKPELLIRAADYLVASIFNQSDKRTVAFGL